VVESGGQFQVVIGNTVNNVYEALITHGEVDAGGEVAAGGILPKAIDLIRSIFTPFLWVLAGTGMLKALLAVSIKIGPRLRVDLDLRDDVCGWRCAVPVPADAARGHGRQEAQGQHVHVLGERRCLGLLRDDRGHRQLGRRVGDVAGVRCGRWASHLPRHPGRHGELPVGRHPDDPRGVRPGQARAWPDQGAAGVSPQLRHADGRRRRHRAPELPRHRPGLRLGRHRTVERRQLGVGPQPDRGWRSDGVPSGRSLSSSACTGASCPSSCRTCPPRGTRCSPARCSRP
jgi:hypothetical protein